MEIQEIATTGASLVVLLAAIGAVARWGMTSAVDKAIDNALRPIRDEVHRIDVRLARVEAKVDALRPSA